MSSDIIASDIIFPKVPKYYIDIFLYFNLFLLENMYINYTQLI